MKIKQLLKRHPIYWIVMGILTSALSTIALTGYLFHLRINTTPSMPEGIWQVLPVNVNKLRQGDVVLVCPPRTRLFKIANQRGYIGRGNCPSGYEPLLKHIIALPGDSVQVSEAGISVNGRLILNSQSIKRDVYGKSLPQIVYGTYPVLKGSVWVLANSNPASFDGRYWGALSISTIEGIAKPVVI